jgi:thioredoxin-like negative regulator of GroEL
VPEREDQSLPRASSRTLKKCLTPFGQSQFLYPLLAAVSQVVGSDFKMFAIDTEKWPHVGSRFKVGKLPCLVVLKEGEVLLRLEGFTRAEDVLSRIKPIYGLTS